MASDFPIFLHLFTDFTPQMVYNQTMNANFRIWRKIGYLTLALLPALLLPGCGHKAYVSSSDTIRDNAPLCLVPTADGTVTYGNDLVCVDASHTEDGYIMADWLGEDKPVKLQVIGPDYMTYTYDLNGSSYETFPLSAGSGSYQIGVYENVEDTQYATVLNETLEISLLNEMGPFLYPNQYVNFTADSDVVLKAEELAEAAHDDLEVIISVYNYIISAITYDYDKAETVQSGYVPNPDEILSAGTGICLDYASVMTSMLRSQQIPTRLEVGYAGEAYHAWISTYVENQGWVNGIIHFDGESWSIMDPTFAASAGEKELKSFIGDGENYVTKYIY